jgi:hypothetical protein
MAVETAVEGEPAPSGQPQHRSSRVIGLVGERRDRVVLAAAFAVFLVGRVLTLVGHTVYTSFDTGSYAPRPGIAEPFNAVSFTGDAPRPWGAPLLYALVPGDGARVLLQWGIGTLAWGVLLFALWINIRSLPARIVAAAALVLLSLSSAVYTWDFAILSESLSIGLGVLVLGLFGIWARTGSRAVAVAIGLVGVWWGFTRPDVLPFVAILLIGLLGYVWLRRERRTSALIAVVLLVLGIGWNLATVSATDESFRKWGLHLGLSESTMVYRLRLQVYPDHRVTQVYQQQLGLPPCPGTEVFGSRTAWAIGDFIKAYEQCPELVAWTQSEKDSAALRYMMDDPKHFTRITLHTLPTFLGGTVGAYARRSPEVPTLSDRLFFPSARPWIVAALVSLLAVSVIACVLVGAFRRRTWLAVTGVAIVAASAASTLFGLLYSAGEYARFGIEEAVLLRVGLIVLVVAAVDAVLSRPSAQPTLDGHVVESRAVEGGEAIEGGAPDAAGRS